MTTAAPALPRRSTSISTRLTMIILPIVILPLLVMGVAAYLRAQQLMRNQATTELAGVVSAENKILQAWRHNREELIAGASQSERIQQPVATLLHTPGMFEAGVALTDALGSLESMGGEILFTDVMVVRAADNLVMAGSDPSLAGRIAPAV
ncbi:MAG: hypothetical protein HW404_1245, partial [Anaerolineales bacterium]|nr:hypothetical protein [Anaerolineales bacterium]